MTKIAFLPLLGIRGRRRSTPDVTSQFRFLPWSNSRRFPQQRSISETLRSLVLLLLYFGPPASTAVIAEDSTENRPPNVVLVITDDQGYGDVGAHGNSMIQTPHLDQLCQESVRLTNYHVDPTCSPTRSALMSGRYSVRTGVWHTVAGRSQMSPEETTLAEAFHANDYRTGMFGKWHLGDNWPLRPQDQGFDDVVMHGGGGVGQQPDYWDNDYNDDTYWRNGVPEKFTGYCTDVWFDEAIAFIKRNQDQPFFLYLSTNAPHAPNIVAPRYSKPYEQQGVAADQSKFYGMITNIDENLGRLRKAIDTLGLTENTILIFTTDNGSAGGTRGNAQWPGFNAGMKGKKGSEYEGGHRVPFFLHWPGGKLDTPRDVNQLTAHIDALPTLMDLCGLKRPDGPPLDGKSLKSILYGAPTLLRDRTLFVHSQRIAMPEKWRKTAVMNNQWRLVNNKELYDLQADPGQKNNVFQKYPQVVHTLATRYDTWWATLDPVFEQKVRVGLGAPQENPTCLNSMDWHAQTGTPPWNQPSIKAGLIANGPWAVDVTHAGTFRFELYRWPKHLNRPMNCTHARITIGQHEKEIQLEASDTRAAFEIELEKGPCMLQSWLTNELGETHGAYYLWVKRVTK